MDKIILVNVFKIVHLGVLMHKIQQLFVLVFALRIHLQIIIHGDVFKLVLLELLQTTQHGNVSLDAHKIQPYMVILLQLYASSIVQIVYMEMIHLDYVN